MSTDPAFQLTPLSPIIWQSNLALMSSVGSPIICHLHTFFAGNTARFDHFEVCSNCNGVFKGWMKTMCLQKYSMCITSPVIVQSSTYQNFHLHSACILLLHFSNIIHCINYSNKCHGGVKFLRRGAFIRVKFIGKEIYLNTSITGTDAYTDAVLKIVIQNV